MAHHSLAVMMDLLPSQVCMYNRVHTLVRQLELYRLLSHLISLIIMVYSDSRSQNTRTTKSAIFMYYDCPLYHKQWKPQSEPLPTMISNLHTMNIEDEAIHT